MKHELVAIAVLLGLVAGSLAEEDPQMQSGDTVTLEGGWENYLTTSLKVRRTISIERDGQSHQANVTAPVLFRRGAVFLDPDKVDEMLKIKVEIEALNAELARIKETSKTLGERYAKLIKEADAQVPVKGEADGTNLGGVAFSSINDENQNQ
jgi:hypothetical protein